LPVLREEGDPDVVVLDYAWPSAAAAAELCAAGLPVLVNGRGSDVLEVAEHAELAAELGAALRLAGHWCAVSSDLVHAMDGLAGIPGRGVLVPNGVDFEAFRPSERTAARARLSLPPASAWVLVVGHLIARKDPLLALEAFARGADLDARIAFVGAGPLERELQDRAREWNLTQRVHLVGRQPSEALPEWYAACDVLLLASSREGRPNVVIEALASGRPVVATRAGGTAELLEGLDGTLVDSRAVEALADALTAMLRSPHSAERCRAQVAGLSWEKSLSTLEALLERARAQKTSA
jgi:glycosyltransferase involved in cell wall biosynthesis